MPKLQLASVLRSLADTHGYSYVANEIKALDDRGPNWRTLQKICEDRDFTISKSHLEAIDTFLRKIGRPGLDHMRLFEPESLLRSLVESRRMTFYLPPVVQAVSEVGGGSREYVSSWDFWAVCSITDSVNEPGVQVHCDFQTGPPRPAHGNPRAINWDSLLERPDRTYCAVGSPLVSGLSSFILGKMFNIGDAFTKLARTYPNPPPFYFCWYPPDDDAGRVPYPSAFALNPTELSERFGDRVSPELIVALNQRRAQAFALRNQVYPVWLDHQRHDQYGIIVAQRRGPQAIWVVIAGLSGPGTYACSQMLPQVAHCLPDCAEGEVSPVVYAAVKSVVAKDQNKPFGDARTVGNFEFVEGTPARWTTSGA